MVDDPVHVIVSPTHLKVQGFGSGLGPGGPSGQQPLVCGVGVQVVLQAASVASDMEILTRGWQTANQIK